MRGSKSGIEGAEAAPEEAAERSGVQSVGIAATILKALAAAGGVLALKHLAAATGMPRAKVHRYLSSLRNAGLITQDPETGHYAIGSAAVTIGLVGLGLTGCGIQIGRFAGIFFRCVLTAVLLAPLALGFDGLSFELT